MCGPLSAPCFYLTQDTLNSTSLGFLNLFLKICISVCIFGYAESLLLRGLFPSRGERGLLSGCIPWLLTAVDSLGAQALGHSASVVALGSGAAALGSRAQAQ